MRFALALMVVLFAACPTARAPGDAGVDAGVDAGPVASPEFFTIAPVLDFGCVARGDELVLPAPDAGGTLGPSSATTFTVANGAIRFAPLRIGDFATSIPIVRGECTIGEQPVFGTAVDAVLTWEPALVDFGLVNPAQTKTSSVTFRSCSRQPITLQNPSAREGANVSQVFGFDAGFTAIPGSSRDGGALIPGELVVEVSCTPLTLGLRQGTFTAEVSSLPSQSMISVSLRCVGGGPRIDVMPTQLDFGAVTVPSTRTLTIRNVGTGALLLGLDGGLPSFEIAPATCGAVTANTYDPVNGLAANDSLTVSVELQPTGAPRTCTLHVFSTDPITPDVEVGITAQ